MKQSRWKSKIMWSAVVAQMLALGQLTGLFAKYGLDAGALGDCAAAILQLLVIIGVLNDPTNKEGF